MASRSLKSSDSLPHSLASSQLSLEEEISALKDQLKYQEQEINRLKEENEKWRQEHILSSKAAEDIKCALYDEIKSLTDENQAHLMEKEELSAVIQKKELESACLRRDNQELSAQLFTSEANLAMAKQDSEKCKIWEKDWISLQTRHIGLNELNLKLKQEMETLQNSHTHDRNHAERDRQEQKMVEKRNEELLLKVDAKNLEIESLRQKMSDLESMICEKDLVNEKLNELLSAARTNYDAVLQVKSDRISALMNTNMRLQQQILHVHRQLNAQDNSRMRDAIDEDEKETSRNGDHSASNGSYVNSTEAVASECSYRYSDFSVNESCENVQSNNQFT